MAYAIDRPHQKQVALASGLDVLAGIWLFISAFAVWMSQSLAWSNGIVGVLVVIMAAIRALGAYDQAWLSWVNAVLGLWVVFSPWIVADFQTSSGVWNNVITGLIIIILASWSAIATQNAHTRGAEPYRRP